MLPAPPAAQDLVRPSAGEASPDPGGTRTTLLRKAPEQREMLLVAGMAFFLNLFPGSLLQMRNPRIGLLVSQVFFIAGPAILALRWFYLDPKAVLPWAPIRLRHIASALLGTLALNHLLTRYGAWQERILPTPPVVRALFDDLLRTRGPWDFLALLVVVAIVPAISEELLFRGFLQSGLARWLQPPMSCVTASALIFALFHFDPWRLVGVAGLGFFLAYLRQVTGSLVPSMLAHAANNMVSVGLAVTGHLDHDRAPGSTLTLIAAAALLALAIAMLPAPRAAGPPAERML
jgi:membrane protease YdiL (CAAX protease family)